MDEADKDLSNSEEKVVGETRCQLARACVAVMMLANEHERKAL